MNIREVIVERRRRRTAIEGPALGVAVPESREVPLSLFPAPPSIICEVKRRSPSRGEIDSTIDPIDHIARYVEGGAKSVSILTEEDYFGGSLTDLIEAKRKYPAISVLRKDFLIDETDIEVSHRAGADAVLLIASILDTATLGALHARAVALGMSALVEVHDRHDIAKARSIGASLVGCNARDLETFRVDLLGPLELRSEIDWPCTTVFESGIQSGEHARIARAGGFDAILVGESVVRNTGLVPELVAALGAEFAVDGVSTTSPWSFWRKVAERRAVNPDRPLVKVCGLTNVDDMMASEELGADLLGFVLAESPRRVSVEFLRALPRRSTGGGTSRTLRIAVVVTGEPRPSPISASELGELVRSGVIDAVQFHGDESPAECEAFGFPWYRALRVGSSEDLDGVDRYRSPRLLVDARSRLARGGTGEMIERELVEAVARKRPLWLAGGLRPGNIAALVRELSPELVDVSSGLEASPGRKDHEAMQRFFEEIDRGCS